jgi:hypothetical protein
MSSDEVTVKLGKGRGLRYGGKRYGPGDTPTIPRSLYTPSLGSLVGGELPPMPEEDGVESETPAIEAASGRRITKKK